MNMPAPTGGHLLGQPFTLSNLSIPVNGTLTCNCAIAHGGVGTAVPIVVSAPVECPSCHRTYVVQFNPSNGQLMVAMSEAPKEPS